MNDAMTVVILAAGRGSRMGTTTNKTCLSLGGKPMVQHVVDTAAALSPAQIVMVVGKHAEDLKASVQPPSSVTWHDICQPKPLGTGDAVLRALAVIPDHHQVLVLYADVPLVQSTTCLALLQEAAEFSVGGGGATGGGAAGGGATGGVTGGGLAVLTAYYAHPYGLGRVVRDEQGRLLRVVEQADVDAEQALIHECFTGILTAPAEFLKEACRHLSTDNANQEAYLPDVIPQWSQGVASLMLPNETDVQGANTMTQLVTLEQRWQDRCRMALLEQGVQCQDPQRLTIRGEVQVGKDVWLDVGVVLEGHVTLGDGCRIGPYVCLKDVQLGPRTHVLSHSVLQGVQAEESVTIGPFAYLRPGTQLAAQAKAGSFVEMKNTQLGAGSKAPHLSYLGDAVIGERVNIGAGTITCNYDGVDKHTTHIENDAFVGSHTQLIAPVRVGEGATIGAGSCIRRDAPAHALTLSRAPQRTCADWCAPRKRKNNGSPCLE